MPAEGWNRMKGRIGAWRGPPGWRRWPLAGLLVALVAVGHDLLMAGDAHAAPPPMQQTALGGHAVPAHTRDAVARAGDDAHATGIASRDGCGSGQAVSARGADASLARSTASTSAGCLRNAPSGTAFGFEEAPPTLPPRVRRALLQVFRV